MKELKINVPKGYEIDTEKSTFENIVFKEINKLPSSWEAFNLVTGYYVDSIAEIWSREEYPLESFCWKNTFKTREQSEASIALAQLSQLRDVYRQGWEPDWRIGNEYKYSINLYKNEISVTDFVYFNQFLSFQDKETAELFLENFRDLIEKAKPLMG